MQIANNDLGLYLKQISQVLSRSDIMAIHSPVSQIANMLAHQILIAFDKAKGVFQVRSGRKDIFVYRCLTIDRGRNIAASPSQKSRLSVNLVYNRIINLTIDIPVMHQEHIRDLSQFINRLLVVANKRFV